MKKLAVVGMVAMLGAGSALGGVVTFGPDLQIDLAARGPVQIPVTLNPDSAMFDAATVLIGSADVPITAFAFAPSWGPPSGFTATEGPLLTGEGPGVYSYEAYFGGNVSPNPLSVDTLVAGMLTIDLTGLAEGSYSVGVSTDVDGGVTGAGIAAPIR